jgi:hypothetical protein
VNARRPVKTAGVRLAQRVRQHILDDIFLWFVSFHQLEKNEQPWKA